MMIIRRAEIRDIPRLLDLLSIVLSKHADIRPDTFKRDVTKYNEEQLEGMINDNKNPIFVAEIDNYVVAHMFLEIRDTEQNIIYKRTLYIDDLCVDDKYRHQQVATRLFEYAVEFAKTNECYNITLNSWVGNNEAENFYQKMGLKPRSNILEFIIK